MPKHVMNAVISRHGKAKRISRPDFNSCRVNHFGKQCAGKTCSYDVCIYKIGFFLSWVTVYFVLKGTCQPWILSLAPIFVE